MATSNDTARDSQRQTLTSTGVASPAMHSNAQTAPVSGTAPAKKKKHRAGKKHKKNRRQSFIVPSETETTEDARDLGDRPTLMDMQRNSTQTSSFYRLHSNNSNTSLESEALLDHRGHEPIRARRQSLQQSAFSRPSLPFARHRTSTATNNGGSASRSRLGHAMERTISEDEDEPEANDRTPLLGSSMRNRSKPELSRNHSGALYGNHGAAKGRRSSAASSRRRTDLPSRGGNSAYDNSDEYDVNNPPSVPASPKLGSLDDIMISELTAPGSDRGRDAVINIDNDPETERFPSLSPEGMRRRPTVAQLAEMDVCFPVDAALSEVGGDDESRHSYHGQPRRRRRGRQWPDLDILEEWSREEKEERTHQEHIRAKKIKEPAMVGGRLRPSKTLWFREEEEAPFRFTYFNEGLDGTIHAQTISDLLQDGTTFRDLFLPDPIVLHSSDSEEDDDPDDKPHEAQPVAPRERLSRQPSIAQRSDVRSPSLTQSHRDSHTPSARQSQAPTPRPNGDQHSPRHGARPTFWLDVLRPTEMEMKVLSKAFGIHQLTAEDIMMEEQREKVELFSNYYFVNYRSFEQDSNNIDYLEPVNIYVVVFRDGVITFHQSMTPHPANVRRRIRQLNDYMSPTADWISYAIIDDVTDVYAPLVQQIEDEVDEIDDEILYLHQNSADNAMPDDVRIAGRSKQGSNEKKAGSSNQADTGAQKGEGEKTAGESGGDMLRRVGECRKKVMGLYRLLGNKADVIKGFAKRCNEHWEVAPRSEIGLYLGDIQDHIVTMTGNLSHYENLLSRAHSNYLAQINIRMNERAEQTADVLGKLTVLGTIVLPMNIITGMWGMNVWVPGQETEGDLTWFWCITAGLVAFGLTSYFVAKKVYGIV